MTLDFTRSLESVPAIWSKTRAHLGRLGLKTVWELLTYFPGYHDDRGNLPAINALPYQAISETTVLIRGQVTQCHANSQSLITVHLSDSTGVLPCLFFNQPHIARLVKPGQSLFVRGRIKADYGQYVMHVSDYEIIGPLTPTGLTPVYALVTGLSPRLMRQAMRAVIRIWQQWQCEYLSDTHRQGQLPWPQTLPALHFPDSLADYTAAKNRWMLDEWLWIQIATGYQRHKRRRHMVSRALVPTGTLTSAYYKQLPYTLTGAQQRVIHVIQQDLQRDYPMNRLIQGDVGCGKTEVAIAAILMTIESGKSAVLMVPTDSLATQHYIKLQTSLEPLAIDVLRLTGRQTKRVRTETLDRLASDKPAVIIGTQALVQASVTLHNIGLIIIDEQHRFGVLQRLTLTTKSDTPHSLYLTATPIPRSLLLTLYNDLDHSVIDEKPPNRQPCKTVYIKAGNAHKVLAYCADQARLNRQIYIVYPAIEESESHTLKAAEAEYTALTQTVFSGLSVGLLHSQLPLPDKQAMLEKFKAGTLAILMSTTIIEVGIDVPNASIMVIYQAERFGLSSLHQLRGRVGRGSDAATCFLIATPKSVAAKQRIKAMVDTDDGFEIAQRDFMIRGGGDTFGTRQSGHGMIVSFLDVLENSALQAHATNNATQILTADPQLCHPNNRMLKQIIDHRFHGLIDEQLN